MTKHIFISYASADRGVADKVCAALEGENMPCWIAPRDVPPGASYGAALVDAIAAAAALVLILSSAYNESPQVIREVERAGSSDIPVLPFCIEDVVLSKDLEFFTSTRHRLDATGRPLRRHLERLAESVRSLVRGVASSEAWEAVPVEAVLHVHPQCDPAAIAEIIAAKVRGDGVAYVHVLGQADTLLRAVKAVAIARGILAPLELDVAFRPAVVEALGKGRRPRAAFVLAVGPP